MLFKFNAGDINHASFVCAAPPENPFTSTPFVLFLPNWLHPHFCEPVTLIDKNPEPGILETVQVLKLNVSEVGSTASPERLIIFGTAPSLVCVIVPGYTPAVSGENFT